MYQKIYSNPFIWPYITKIRLEWIYGLKWRDGDFWRLYLEKMPNVHTLKSSPDYFCTHSKKYYQEELNYLDSKNIMLILDK